MNPTRTLALAATALALAGLAACSKPADESTTVGQKIDSAVASTERAAKDLQADAAAAAGQAKASAGEAANAVATTAGDIAVTAKVKAALAADQALSALRIDVDTQSGRVALNGSAPSADARERASTLAGQVEGVVAVDNRLKVEPRS